MNKFSAGEAAFYGFGLIKRDPMTFLGITLLYALIGVYLALVLLPAYADFLGLMMTAPDDEEAILGAVFGFYGMIGQMLLLSLPVAMIILGAVQRSLVHGQSKGWFLGLKLGMDEVRVILVTIVCYLFIVVLPYIGIAVVVGLFAAVMAATGGESAAAAVGLGVLMLVAMVGAIVVIVWLAIRLSAAGPATVGEQRFVIFESWKITKGRFWTLFLAYLILYAIVLVAETVIAGVVVAVVGAAFFQFGPPEEFDPSMLDISLGPLVIVGAVIYGVVYTFFLGGFLGVGARGYLDWKQTEGGSAEVFS
ncbi:MAG: hypothetical protein PVI23_06425 [Maricaulaceae bacterium]|jgi:hypothetical protein